MKAERLHSPLPPDRECSVLSHLTRQRPCLLAMMCQRPSNGTMVKYTVAFVKYTVSFYSEGLWWIAGWNLKALYSEIKYIVPVLAS